MTRFLKKPAFLLPFARLFTRGEKDAYDAISFQYAESCGDETIPALTAPSNWSAEAVSIMVDAACNDIPAETYTIEENTVPSWLWRRHNRGTRRTAENDLHQIFNRAVGSAVAKAWNLNLFSSEKNARAFYDEARYALMQRHIAIVPDVMRAWGLGWAYNIKTKNFTAQPARDKQTTALSNTTIDTLIGNGKQTQVTMWKKLFAASKKQPSSVTLRLSDIANDWHSASATPAQAAIDLMALRHNDGGINIDALRQITRILTILLDLQDSTATIGLANLAPLLLALGLGYDSEAGRAMAASLAALVTAECYAVSAEMAALRGTSDAFTTDREAVIRTLRNHRRAAYGDHNDYEKLSVLPAPLPLKNCPDLTLVAEAQHRWDDAVQMASAFGLRATHVTDLTPSPVLAMLMQSSSQGLEPLHSLMTLTPDDSNMYRAELHPAVGEALTRLAYPRNINALVAQHIAGTRSLLKAPAINAKSLRASGINDAAFEKIEAYLPCVNTIRLAVTPWIVGIDHCRTQLKIPTRLLESSHFDLLKHLGFSDGDVDATNIYCYGHGTVRNCKIVHIRHRSLFACGNEVSIEARIRMAASVQGFISGDTGVVATLPIAHSVERGTEITLSAWRRGLKSLTIAFDPEIVAPAVREAHPTARRIKAGSHAHAKPISTAGRVARSKNSGPAPVTRKQVERRTRSV